MRKRPTLYLRFWCGSRIQALKGSQVVQQLAEDSKVPREVILAWFGLMNGEECMEYLDELVDYCMSVLNINS